MKTLGYILVFFASGICGLQADQTATSSTATAQSTPILQATEYRVIGRDANQRVWQRETYEQGPSGQTVTNIHCYTELATGLHYKDAKGQWVESKELIEAYPGGAVARQGQHQVIFANNLNSRGAIDMQTLDGKRLRSNILGLMYVDTATGGAVLIAEIKDSEGQLISDNQVLYPDAFEGVKADVQYTYRRDGFEQDVILREQPPTPESFGMNPDTTELEVITEFINPPEASVKDSEADNGLEADQEIGWGGVTLGRGKAFNLGDQTTQAPVAKRYVNLHGRYFLLEKVPMKDIQPDVSKLPEQAANSVKLPVMAFKSLILPKTPLARSGASPMRLASTSLPDKGYVLDYVTVNASLTNYTFQGDTTYYVSGTVTLNGTNTFEGGTVLKFATNGAVVMAGSYQAINWRASMYRPVIFTAKDDNTVGENFGTGTPTGYYGAGGSSYAMLVLAVFSPQAPLTGLRISYANNAIGCFSGSFSFKDVQFINCQNGFSLGGANVTLGNALFANTKTNFFYQGGSTVAAQNVTFSGSVFVASVYSSGNYLALTNCVLANVTNLVSGSLVTTNGNFNGFYQSPVFGLNPITNSFYPFQRVGGGSYYLTNGCGFFNVGTTNISSTTLAGLKTKTTCPPIVYSNTTISVATTLSPQAQRDIDTPDLGYHYDPLDYAFNMTSVSSNITFAAGTAVAWFSKGTSPSPGWGVGDPWGLGLANDVVVTFAGTATNPCKFVAFNAVQEGSSSVWMWAYVGGICAISSYDANHFPAINANFTLLSHPSGVATHFRDYNNGLIVGAINSGIYGSCGGYDIELWLTNSLLFRVNYWQGTADPAYAWEAYRNVFQNCTFYGGSLEYAHWEGSPYWKVFVQNCAFDGTALKLYNAGGGMSWLTASYNATNNTMSYGGNPLSGANNVPVSGSYKWQSSWFGDFYLPTNSLLINAGSTNANLLALYHFTTQTNQVKETNSIVDIGYHYVATDGYGNPYDTDGDGLPDYLEDANGNGVFDTGDLGNWLISPFNGLSTANGLSVFTPLK